MIYTAWYIPDGYSEPLTMTFGDSGMEFPPYNLSEDEIVDFILSEVDERGVALEIRRTDGNRFYPAAWQNKSWGID